MQGNIISFGNHAATIHCDTFGEDVSTLLYADYEDMSWQTLRVLDTINNAFKFEPIHVTFDVQYNQKHGTIGNKVRLVAKNIHVTEFLVL